MSKTHRNYILERNAEQLRSLKEQRRDAAERKQRIERANAQELTMNSWLNETRRATPLHARK